MNISFLVVMSLLALPLLQEPVVRRDLVYDVPGHDRQKLDVYFRPGGADRPIVFWIHGGGWQAGDKKDVDAKPPAFVDRGYVFVSVNYRLLGDGVTIDRMAEDVAKAIRWVCDRAGDYGGDPKRILISGHSAGAQLAALLCTDPRYLAREKLPLSIVKGCVPVDGDTYDVPLQIETVEDRRANIYRRKFGEPARQRELSAVTHAVPGRDIPPFLILYVADHPEVKLQSHRLAEALRAAGVRARAYAAEGKNHLSINSELGRDYDKPTAEMFTFVERVLRRSPIIAPGPVRP